MTSIEHEGLGFNPLDTPGNQDFGERTDSARTVIGRTIITGLPCSDGTLRDRRDPAGVEAELAVSDPNLISGAFR